MIKKILFVLIGFLILVFFIYALYDTDEGDEETGTGMQWYVDNFSTAVPDSHTVLE